MPNSTADKLTFMGQADKARARPILRSALLASIAHFNADARSSHFKDLPNEVREGFFSGVTGAVQVSPGTLFIQESVEGRVAAGCANVWTKRRQKKFASRSKRWFRRLSARVCNGRRLRLIRCRCESAGTASLNTRR